MPSKNYTRRNCFQTLCLPKIIQGRTVSKHRAFQKLYKEELFSKLCAFQKLYREENSSLCLPKIIQFFVPSKNYTRRNCFQTLCLPKIIQGKTVSKLCAFQKLYKEELFPNFVPSKNYTRRNCFQTFVVIKFLSFLLYCHLLFDVISSDTLTDIKIWMFRLTLTIYKRIMQIGGVFFQELS